MNRPVKFSGGRNIAMKVPPHLFEATAAQYLNEAGVIRCDEIEPLPEGFEGFWIANPASIIHLVCNDKAQL